MILVRHDIFQTVIVVWSIFLKGVSYHNWKKFTYNLDILGILSLVKGFVWFSSLYMGYREWGIFAERLKEMYVYG